MAPKGPLGSIKKRLSDAYRTPSWSVGGGSAVPSPSMITTGLGRKQQFALSRAAVIISSTLRFGNTLGNRGER